MASLTIKGIPDDLLERLREVAAENRRSLNSEVIYRLERSVEPTRAVDPEVFLARVRALNAQAPVPPLTDEFLQRAIDEGRP
jgi:antitoxin FitA